MYSTITDGITKFIIFFSIFRFCGDGDITMINPRLRIMLKINKNLSGFIQITDLQ